LKIMTKVTEHRKIAARLAQVDDLFPKPFALFVRFAGFVAIAAAVQVALFYGADLCRRLGYPAAGKAYMSVALYVYAPGLRLFWLITAKPAMFDVFYGVLGMFFILATYSVLLGAVAMYSYGLVGRAFRRAARMRKA
jgi:hypothetical protein